MNTSAIRVATRWIGKTAGTAVHGIAVYQGKIDPQTSKPLVVLMNSAVPRDVGASGYLAEDALLKIRKNVPFLVEYNPATDDDMNFIPLTKLN